ncbi:uncharacterized protein LOC122503694 isoform X2 [Leptopilina heterotoma]|uniref:uncharacterized protein LOC122503694 isoform X2 n=1 Tax=Leptopilina heterotoma TaxID=63436 RepID=UPI001CA90670|nr:uncharacterized protein LOC122503694 isoform X2 [Leptopilina heterotoma]
MPGKLKSADEQCIEAGMKGFFAQIAEECIIACNNESDSIFNEDNEPSLDYEVKNILTDVSFAEITAQDGYECIDGYCLGGQCIPNHDTNTTLSNSRFSSNNSNRQELLVPKDVPLLFLEALFQLADEECKNARTSGASKVSPTDCVLHCMVPSINSTAYQILPIEAPNGFPCSNNGICLNRIFMKVI